MYSNEKNSFFFYYSAFSKLNFCFCPNCNHYRSLFKDAENWPKHFPIAIFFCQQYHDWLPVTDLDGKIHPFPDLNRDGHRDRIFPFLGYTCESKKSPVNSWRRKPLPSILAWKLPTNSLIVEIKASRDKSCGKRSFASFKTYFLGNDEVAGTFQVSKKSLAWLICRRGRREKNVFLANCLSAHRNCQ